MRLTIGLPVYNGAQYLTEALESLLGQTYGDFVLHIHDNASTDSTFDIARSFAVRDRRILLCRNKRNVGMLKNFHLVESVAATPHFMWASDHDVWAPTFVEKCMSVLDNNNRAVLVYPLTKLINNAGAESDKPPKRFEARGKTGHERLRVLWAHGKGYGAMVYGVFRRAALVNSGIYRRVLMPDVQLVWELSTIGELIQIPETLFWKRLTEPFSLKRQKKSLFPRHPPWYINLPWPLTGAFYLAWYTIVHRKQNSDCQTGQLLLHSLNYFLCHVGLISRDYPVLGRLIGPVVPLLKRQR